MKKFLKLTKFKIAISLIGGFIYPFWIFLLSLELSSGVSNSIKNVATIIMGIFATIISIIPGFIIMIFQRFFDPESLIIDNEEVYGFYWTAMAILTVVFNLILFYLIASWIEWRKNKKSEENN